MKKLINNISNCLIRASSVMRKDQINRYEELIKRETSKEAKEILNKIVENSQIAKKKKFPLCDDTGIPHVILEVGDEAIVNKELIEIIKLGICKGLRELPGRPMAVKGSNIIDLLTQRKGIYQDPGALLPASIVISSYKGKKIKFTIIMLGGGPEIRSKTFRIFHRHMSDHIFDEIIKWMFDVIPKLGCTPCVPAIGIGRTHFEATSLMLFAMKEGSFEKQSRWEQMITNTINKTGIGPLGVGGASTALATFLKVGPQRASGVRIACMRLGCCFDPRKDTIIIDY